MKKAIGVRRKQELVSGSSMLGNRPAVCVWGRVGGAAAPCLSSFYFNSEKAKLLSSIQFTFLPLSLFPFLLLCVRPVQPETK